MPASQDKLQRTARMNDLDALATQNHTTKE
jgi:hypothetical protein